MKKILVLVFACTCMMASAQDFVRYYMNDSSYNGFYIKSINAMSHICLDDIYYNQVLTNDSLYTIPIENIDSVSFEETIAENGSETNYRIYELNCDTLNYKKAYIDNRAVLFASQNGTFGANDTILLSSKYNGITLLLTTNANGRLKTLFDGTRFFFVDYETDSTHAILVEMSNGGYTIHQKLAYRNSVARNSRNSIGSIRNEVILMLIPEGLGFSLNAFESVINNPENHNQLILMNGLSVAGDIIGIGAAIAGGIPTGGASLLLLSAQIGLLLKDMLELVNSIYPSAEQMDIYKKYYQDAYGINVITKETDNITYSSATLNGLLSLSNGIKGNTYFTLSSFDSQLNTINITASTKEESIGHHSMEGSATNLKTGETYLCTAYYEVIIDGLKFTYSSENYDMFTTKYPAADTGESSNIEENSAVVECTYFNIYAGATCGVKYTWDGGESQQIVSSSEGTQSITLSGLTPATTYTYRAFVQVNGETYYGAEKTFTTLLPDISGTWTCTETHYRNNNINYPYYTTYSVTLNKDGSVSYSEYENCAGGSWSFQADGTVAISVMLIATQTQNSGKKWKGVVNDIKKPTQITGSTYSWNVNTIGYYQGDSYEVILTR